MSDSEHSAEDRTLSPSEKRLQDAREEGQVPRSREFASFMLMGAALVGLVSLGPTLFRDSLEVVSGGLRFDHQAAVTEAAMGQRLMLLSGAAFLAALPILGLLLAIAIAAPMAIGGWNFTWKPIMPNFGKLDPLQGIGRIFNRHGVIELAKQIVIVGAIVAMVSMMLLKEHEKFAQLVALPLRPALAESGSFLAYALATLVGVLAVAAALDVPAQLWRHYSSLRMTPEEAKRENRESDGDPHIKAKIRAQQREMAKRRMMEAVPTADVVVTNPTHYAVALVYQDGKMRAPKVVAKGMDEVAQKIRDIANLHRVPILEQPALARALHRHAEINEEVPVALYQAVAQVLAYVYQLKRFVPGRGMTLQEPGEIAVPDGLDPKSSSAHGGAL
ncbi:MAG: flagellar biosynthesis protein FlhB [Betaproteobacteria bacterium]|nr:flagellar biosynthesis protein FlhB [Betaproteobacteria bacterium]